MTRTGSCAALRRLARARRAAANAEQAYYDGVAGSIATGERAVDLADALEVNRRTVYRHAGRGTPGPGDTDLDIEQLVARAAGRARAKVRLREAAAAAKAAGVTITDISRTLEVTRRTVYQWIEGAP